MATGGTSRPPIFMPGGTSHTTAMQDEMRPVHLRWPVARYGMTAHRDRIPGSPADHLARARAWLVQQPGHRMQDLAWCIFAYEHRRALDLANSGLNWRLWRNLIDCLEEATHRAEVCDGMFMSYIGRLVFAAAGTTPHSPAFWRGIQRAPVILAIGGAPCRQYTDRFER